MSLLQIDDICRQCLLYTFCRQYFFDLYRHFVDVTFSTNQKSSPLMYTLVVYIDLFCRHLQTLFHTFMNTFHIFVDNFIIIKKLLFSVQFFVNNCSSQTHKLLACCLRRHYCRSLQTILWTLLQYFCLQSEFFIQTQFFVYVDILQTFVDTFVVLK